MLMIDNAVVTEVLTMRDCIRVQREAFDAFAEGHAALRPRIDIYAPSAKDTEYFRWGSCEGVSHEVVAVRLKSDVVSWPVGTSGEWVEEKYAVRPGFQCGLVLLFSTQDGSPLAIIQDGRLHRMRVGGAAGIGTDLLARADSTSLGVIGSGRMARRFIEAICAVRTIDRVRVFSPDESHRRAFAREMSEIVGLEIEPVNAARTAVAGADVLATCTNSMQPVFDPTWLEPGQHHVSLNPRECDPEAYARADVCVIQGHEELDIPETPDFRKDLTNSPGAFFCGTDEERSRVPRAHDLAEFRGWPTYADVRAGRAPCRQNDDQITHYQTSGNWGLQFSSIGALVHRLAKERGLGHEIPQSWFVQDSRA